MVNFISHRERRKATTDQKKKAADDMQRARDELAKAYSEQSKADIDRLNAVGTKAMDDLFENSETALKSEIDQNTKSIAALEAERNEKMGKAAGTPADLMASDMDPTMNASSLPPAPAPGATPAPPPAVEPDYFSSISVNVEASYQHADATQKSSTTSVSASGSLFGVSIGGSGSHTQSSADAESQMANSAVKVTFECMRVDIGRDWLRPELFLDDDLQVAKNA